MKTPQVCFVCKEPVPRGQCRACQAALCPKKPCHLAHRADNPKKFPPFRVLPGTCPVERSRLSQSVNTAHATLSSAYGLRDKHARACAVLGDDAPDMKEERRLLEQSNDLIDRAQGRLMDAQLKSIAAVQDARGLAAA